MIYRFRVILDVENDVFRDIEIQSQANLEDFHNAITQSFGFQGNEMASFYKSDADWNQGEEFSLFEMEDARLMAETTLEEVVNEEEKYLLYVYDFFNMWTFFVELKEVGELQTEVAYPNLLFAHGQVPDQAPEKQFETDDWEQDFQEEFDDFEFDQEEFDDYYGYNEDENY